MSTASTHAFATARPVNDSVLHSLAPRNVVFGGARGVWCVCVEGRKDRGLTQTLSQPAGRHHYHDARCARLARRGRVCPSIRGTCTRPLLKQRRATTDVAAQEPALATRPHRRWACAPTSPIYCRSRVYGDAQRCGASSRKGDPRTVGTGFIGIHFFFDLSRPVPCHPPLPHHPPRPPPTKQTA